MRRSRSSRGRGLRLVVAVAASVLVLVAFAAVASVVGSRGGVQVLEEDSIYASAVGASERRESTDKHEEAQDQHELARLQYRMRAVKAQLKALPKSLVSMGEKLERERTQVEGDQAKEGTEEVRVRRQQQRLGAAEDNERTIQARELDLGRKQASLEQQLATENATVASTRGSSHALIANELKLKKRLAAIRSLINKKRSRATELNHQLAAVDGEIEKIRHTLLLQRDQAVQSYLEKRTQQRYAQEDKLGMAIEKEEKAARAVKGGKPVSKGQQARIANLKARVKKMQNKLASLYNPTTQAGNDASVAGKADSAQAKQLTNLNLKKSGLQARDDALFNSIHSLDDKSATISGKLRGDEQEATVFLSDRRDEQNRARKVERALDRRLAQLRRQKHSELSAAARIKAIHARIDALKASEGGSDSVVKTDEAALKATKAAMARMRAKEAQLEQQRTGDSAAASKLHNKLHRLLGAIKKQHKVLAGIEAAGKA